MLELVMVLAAVVLMSRMAGMEGKSGVLIGAITLGVCMAAVYLVPLPFFRVLLGALAVFVGWTAFNMLGKT